MLGVAAFATVRTKDNHLAEVYRRIAARRGAKRAVVAVMRKLVIAIWHVLNGKTVFHDLGADYLSKRDPGHAMRRMQRQANNLGFTIRCDPIPEAG